MMCCRRALARRVIGAAAAGLFINLWFISHPLKKKYVPHGGVHGVNCMVRAWSD